MTHRSEEQRLDSALALDLQQGGGERLRVPRFPDSCFLGCWGGTCQSSYRGRLSASAEQSPIPGRQHRGCPLTFPA